MRIQELLLAQRGLEARLSRLEALLGAAGPAHQPRTPVKAVTPNPTAGPSGLDVGLADLGQALLLMAGAFMLRAFTDSGLLPLLGGVALGLVYAVLWIGLAGRAAGRGKPVRALTYGITAALIAYPILWEAPTRFGVMPPGLAALLAAVLVALALLAGWRQRIRSLAWVHVSGAMAVAVALHFATGVSEPFIGLLLLLGLGTVWLGYHFKWHGLRWWTALVTDFMVLVLVSIASSGNGVPAHYAGLSVGLAQGLAGALLVVYLGSFALRTLWRQRDVTLFEVVQTAAALAIGFGGAVRIAHAHGHGGQWLGPAALVAAGACYLVAFAFVDRRVGRGRNFIFYTSLALVLAMTGSTLVSGGAALSLIWGLLGLASAVLGVAYDRITLRVHSALYLAVAAWRSGLLGFAFAAFLAPAPRLLDGPGAAGYIVLLLALLGYLVLAVVRRHLPGSEQAALPRLALLVTTVLGLAGLLVALALRLASSWDVQDLTAAAVVARVAVPSGAAVLLATGGRRRPLREWTWLVYPVLALGGAMLLVGLRQGHAGALFLGCAFFGGALIASPWLLRARGPRPTPAGGSD